MGCSFERKYFQHYRGNQESIESPWHHADSESVYNKLVHVSVIYSERAALLCSRRHENALFYIGQKHENEHCQFDREKREIVDLVFNQTEELFVQCRRDICIQGYKFTVH